MEELSKLLDQLTPLVPGPASEERFWKRANEINWDQHTSHRDKIVDVDYLHQKLTESVSVLEFIALHKKEVQLFTKLKEHVSSWMNEAEKNKIALPDDRFDHLIHHIVGLGQNSYEHALAHPKAVKARAERGTFREDFDKLFVVRDTTTYRPHELKPYFERVKTKRNYDSSLTFTPGEFVTHDAFGEGVVIGTDSTKGAYVVFAEGEHKLVTNRKPA
jgi:hypothetical protein